MAKPQISFRNLQPTPASLNRETREVDGIIATQNPVNRGSYVEILDVSGLMVNESVGSPILDNHNANSVDNVLGKIKAIRIHNGQVIATLAFSQVTRAMDTFTRIGEGILTGISIGYQVLEKRNETRNGQRVTIVTRFIIRECSITIQPADSSTGFRSQNHHQLNGGSKMDDNQQQQTQTTQQAPPISSLETRNQIRTLGRQNEIEAEEIDKLIDSGASLDQAKSHFWDLTQTRNRKAEIKITATQDDPATFQRRCEKALMVRMAGWDTLEKDDRELGAVREFKQRTLAELAIESMQRNGQDVRGLNQFNVWDRLLQTRSGSMTTSDLPTMLTSSGNRILIQKYGSLSSPLKMAMTRIDLADYRETRAVRLSEAEDLLETEEGGEIVSSILAEESEPMQVKDYKRKIVFTQRMLRNDDLAGLGDLFGKYARMVTRWEAEQIANKINSPGNMSDGFPVFERKSARSGKGRDNVTVGMFDNTFDLGDARRKLRKRKGLGGHVLDLNIAYLITDSNYETQAEKLLAEIQPDEVAHANVFSGKIRLLSSAYLSDDSAFFVARPEECPSLAYHYLQGMDGPQMAMMEDFDTQDIKFRVTHQFGCSWIDFRGWEKLEPT